MEEEYFTKFFLVVLTLFSMLLIYWILNKKRVIKDHEKIVWKIAFFVIFLGFSYKIFSLKSVESIVSGLSDDVMGKLLLAGLMVVVFDVWMHRVTQNEVKAAASEATRIMKDEALAKIDESLEASIEKIVDSRVRPDVQDAIKIACADTELSISCVAQAIISKLNGSDAINIDLIEVYIIHNESNRNQNISFRKLSTSRSISIASPVGDHAQNGVRFDAEGNIEKIEIRHNEKWEITIQHELQSCHLSGEIYVAPLFFMGARKYEITVSRPSDIVVDCKMHGGWYDRVKSRDIGDIQSSKKTKFFVDSPLFPYVPIFLKFDRNLVVSGQKSISTVQLTGLETENYVANVDDEIVE